MDSEYIVNHIDGFISYIWSVSIIGILILFEV